MELKKIYVIVGSKTRQANANIIGKQARIPTSSGFVYLKQWFDTEEEAKQHIKDRKK